MIQQKQAHEISAGIVTDPAFEPILMIGAKGLFPGDTHE